MLGRKKKHTNECVSMYILVILLTFVSVTHYYYLIKHNSLIIHIAKINHIKWNDKRYYSSNFSPSQEKQKKTLKTRKPVNVRETFNQLGKLKAILKGNPSNKTQPGEHISM